MKVSDTGIAGAKLVEPRVFGDHRGFFLETWNERDYAAAGITAQFVQDNHSLSGRGTLRGLHYQLPHTQGKLVRVVHGAVFDVIVDLRRSSPTFRRWYGIELSAANRRQLWVPPGLAHGFYVLSDGAEFVYKCTDYYAPASEHTLLWNDESIGVQWPMPPGAQPVLSAKDAAGTRFELLEVFP